MAKTTGKTREEPKKTYTRVVYVGDTMVSGAMVKLNQFKVLFRFAEKVLGTPYFEDNGYLMIKGLDPETPGDPRWMNDTVFRRADLIGTTSDAEAEKRAEKLKTAYDELSKSRNEFGFAVIDYFLDHTLLKYAKFEE